MKTDLNEKRKFNRVPFSYSDNITGTFIRHGSKEKFTALILHFSMQGVYFTLSKNADIHLNKSDTLAFLEIKGLKTQDFIINIELEIARLLDHSELDYFGYGCAFSYLPESSLHQIRRFIEFWFLESR
ncbi:MAG: PilZ domain-containing protein [Calditrichales bacterium]|nr:MAG: PilZ domain-containing protein [Calditrichales bacterium]